MRTHRRDNRWADKQYKKRALGTAFKSSPFGGSSHAKGIVLEKMYVFARERRKDLGGLWRLGGCGGSMVKSRDKCGGGKSNEAVREDICGSRLACRV